MQHASQLNWLDKLAVLSALATSLAQAAPLTINSGDIAWNQDGAGTDVRIRYDALSDGYYLNTNTSTKWVSGIGNGLAWDSFYWKRTDEGNGTAFIERNGADNLAWLRWEFNFAKPIEALTVINTSVATPINGHFSVVEWSASVDGGATWNYYQKIQSGTTGDAVTDGGVANNLTTFATGKTSLLLRAYLGDWQNADTNQQIFRTNSGADWGLDMKVSLVPEPASLALLALSGLLILRRRQK